MSESDTTTDAYRRLQAELACARAEARTDALTGLPNRRAFDEELVRRYAAWQRQGAPLALAMIDLDDFKGLNDRFGHRAGDEVLRGIGRALRGSTRDMDFLARYGGEEFALILPCTGLKGAVIAAQRVREAIQSARFAQLGDLQAVTASLGVAAIGPEDTMASWLDRADQAMYAAKRAGRNRVCCHDGESVLLISPRAVSPR